MGVSFLSTLHVPAHIELNIYYLRYSRIIAEIALDRQYKAASYVLISIGLSMFFQMFFLTILEN